MPARVWLTVLAVGLNGPCGLLTLLVGVDIFLIIQDNEEDCNVQSKLIVYIYSNAVLAITTATSEDSSAGLFIDRDPTRNISLCTKLAMQKLR